MMNKIITGKKNGWRYWLFHLVSFLAIIVLFDLAIGSTLQHFYFKMKSGVQYRATYAIEKTKADIIVFGSSRAVHHYVPEIFEDRFKLSYYNAGRDGEESSLYHYAVLKGMLKRYTPKIVILDLMNGELGNKLYPYSRLASLSPYYSTHPEMRPIIELRSDHEKLKMLSGIYPFNSLVMSIISGNLDVHGKKNTDTRGYLPIPSTFVLTKPVLTFDKSEKYELDSTKINVLRSFISDCIQSNIKLYIVFSPYYDRYTGTDYSLLTIKKMAEEYHVNFFDLSQEKTFLEGPKLFGDSWHLNDSGARVFSKMLIDKIAVAENKRVDSIIK